MVQWKIHMPMIALGGLCMLPQSNPTRQGLFFREAFEKRRPGTGESVSLSNRSNERQLNLFSRTMNHYLDPAKNKAVPSYSGSFYIATSIVLFLIGHHDWSCRYNHSSHPIPSNISVHCRIALRSLQGLCLDWNLYEEEVLVMLFVFFVHFITDSRPGRVLTPFLFAVESSVPDHSHNRRRQHVHIVL